ncbi:MAG: spermidine/putrescine transport system substrate-binding protein, partial [Halioglobus sp.]
MDLKRSTLILAIRTLALCCFLSSDSLADQLTVYTWFDYFPERFIKQFEKRSGHTIKLVYFYSDLERDTEIFNAQAGYDVIITDAHTLPSFASSDIFLKAETQKIPNLKNLDPRWSNTCSDLGVPFFWGGAGIAYRSSQVIGSIDSWRDLLFPEPALRGRIGMLNESFDLMVPALKLSGASVNTTSLAELKSAYKVLQAQKPHVLSYSSSYEALLLNLGNRSLALAEAYSGKQ